MQLECGNLPKNSKDSSAMQECMPQGSLSPTKSCGKKPLSTSHQARKTISPSIRSIFLKTLTSSNLTFWDSKHWTLLIALSNLSNTDTTKILIGMRLMKMTLRSIRLSKVVTPWGCFRLRVRGCKISINVSNLVYLRI